MSPDPRAHVDVARPLVTTTPEPAQTSPDLRPLRPRSPRGRHPTSSHRNPMDVTRPPAAATPEPAPMSPDLRPLRPRVHSPVVRDQPSPTPPPSAPETPRSISNNHTALIPSAVGILVVTSDCPSPALCSSKHPRPMSQQRGKLSLSFSNSCFYIGVRRNCFSD
jgi:hypothetical protein